MSQELIIARATNDIAVLPRLANRHGLIAGATGTGKTVTLQVMAEQFSRIGVPVFLADVKGDLAGISQPGSASPRISERLTAMGRSDHRFEGCPVTFWDLYGEKGHPIRTTVSDMGPLLLSRLLNLNETQSGVLSLVFKIADDSGLLLLDLKDLQAMLRYVADNAKQYTTQYGNVSSASVGAIQRGLLTLEEQGGERFFGEPALRLDDLFEIDSGGKGRVNILAADRLMQSPKLYATFLLWLLAELFEQMPEVGDQDKPKLVFFFDEAHLLFEDAPKALLEKIEQVVRLIRSKSVGVYFVTQNPLDIPEPVLAQLGNRVQHALRAFTPKDQKTVKAVAQNFRGNPAVNVEEKITQLQTGEALVSFLDKTGSPTPVEAALIYPPSSQIGPIADELRGALIKQSPAFGAYEQTIDRESAYERLKARAEQSSVQPEPQRRQSGTLGRTPARSRQTTGEAMAKSAARAVGSQLGRALVRGLLGSLLGGRR